MCLCVNLFGFHILKISQYFDCFIDSEILLSSWFHYTQPLSPTVLLKPLGSLLECLLVFDRFDQKQEDGCVLTNPLNDTPLRPDSTFIDGFSWAIHQKIADFNSYPLRYQFWKSVYKCWAGTHGVAFSGFVKTHPSACFCSKRSDLFVKSVGDVTSFHMASSLTSV